MDSTHRAYRRERFSARLPLDRVFTEAHFWLAPEDGGTCRVGFTNFATRMLGEVVEFDFEVSAGDVIEEGQVIGWFEGFKAVSDLYSPLAGSFVSSNPDLDDVIENVHKSPYDRGWLFRAEGTPPDTCMDADQYAAFLDGTIDRMTGKTGETS